MIQPKQMFQKLVGYSDVHSSAILVSFGALLTIVALYLLILSYAAINDVNGLIHTIPNVIQVEMKRTREMYHQEADTNKEFIKEVVGEEHTVTREKLLLRMTALEEERKRLIIQLERQISRVAPEPSQKKGSFFKLK